MNFLGHLYFSGDHYPLMMANLFGDFVKGKNFSHLPPVVKKGALLHRSIDSFIDQHPAITRLRKELYTPLPKIAGVAIDLFMDHLLAKNWSTFHTTPLTSYTKKFFHFALDENNQSFQLPLEFTYPKEFIELLTIIHSGNWIVNYKDLAGLRFACVGLSRRISFPNLLHQAPLIFVQNELLITETFYEFMSDAKAEFGMD